MTLWKLHNIVLFLTYKFLNALTLQYLSSLLHQHSTSQTPCSLDTGLLSIPHTRLRCMVASTLWKSPLPPEIHHAQSLEIFTPFLKTHPFSMAFPWHGFSHSIYFVQWKAALGFLKLFEDIITQHRYWFLAVITYKLFRWDYIGVECGRRAGNA